MSSRPAYQSINPGPIDYNKTPSSYRVIEPVYRSEMPRPAQISSFRGPGDPQYIRRDLDLYDAYNDTNGEFTPEIKQVIGMYMDTALDTSEMLVYGHDALNRPENAHLLNRDKLEIQRFHTDLKNEADMHR